MVIGGAITTGANNISAEIFASNLTSEIYNNIISTLKPVLALLGGLLGIYILYLIIKLIMNYYQSRRIKRIEKNTNLIIDRLNMIEKKLTKRR